MKDTHELQVELSKTKIYSMRHELDLTSSVFAEKGYLESLGPPRSLIGREVEAKQLLEHVYVKKGNFTTPFVSVYGKSGTGKSSIVKTVCTNLNDKVSFSFVNLRKARTNFECANLILTTLDASTVKSYEGINKAIEQIEERILETLIRDKKDHFILVLDEFDVIFSDVRARPSDFVYKLLNIAESLGVKGYFLCIVVISNSTLDDFVLDERVKSRMGNYEIFFAPYRKKEIFSILRDRSKRAFTKKIDYKVLHYCAQLSGEESGDCRKALELLRTAGEIAKGKKVTVSHVDKAAKQLDNDKLDMILETVTPHQLLLLAAMAKLTMQDQRDEHSTNEIYETYQSILPCPKLKPLSYRTVFNLLSELENTGILIVRTHSKGRHGYRNYYRLTVHYDLIGWNIDPDWWMSERGMKERMEIFENIKKEVFGNQLKVIDRKRKMNIVMSRFRERCGKQNGQKKISCGNN